MGGLISLIISGIFIIIAVGCFRSIPQRKHVAQQETTIINDADYVYKLARLARTSEYKVFEKTAENWSVTQAMIDRDFHKYLDSQTTPYYVSHYIRENKEHLDELRTPHYWQ